MAEQISIKLIRSIIGRPEKHCAVVKGLGLTKLNKTVVLNNTPEVQGMIKKIAHLVAVTE
jgi:large subunit ribosomal protein L30